MFIGADNQSVQQMDQMMKGSNLQWTNSFYPEEVIIHYKYYITEVRNNTKYIRKGDNQDHLVERNKYMHLHLSDYDIALLRINYPVLDEKTGSFSLF